MAKEKLYLVDGSSYIYRAFYAIRPLTSPKGLPTNAIYGFVRMILKLIKEQKPSKIAVVFDTKEPTFRDELYPKYKANRSEPPDDLIPQFEYFQPVVDLLGIKKLAVSGVEADDIIGTVAKRAEGEGFEVVIVTGDKDFMQLVGDNIKLYDTMKEKWVGAEEVKKKFGVPPEKVIDVMSLMGDSSDNIPGVSGIGEKGASLLINQYGSLDELFKNADKVSNARSRQALKTGKEAAEISRKLVTIKLDVPVNIDWSEFAQREYDAEKMNELFTELGFYTLLKELIPAKDISQASSQRRLGSSEHHEIPAPALSEVEGFAGMTQHQASDDIEEFETSLAKTTEVAVYFEEIEGELPFKKLDFFLEKGGAFSFHLTDEVEAKLPSIFSSIVNKRLYFYSAKDIAKSFFCHPERSEGPPVRSFTKFTLSEVEGFRMTPDLDIADIRLMAYVSNPANPSELDPLVQKLLQKPLHSFSNSAVAIFELGKKLEAELAGDKKLSDLYSEIEMPLWRILYKMEEKGIKVDVNVLNGLSKEFGEKLCSLEKKIFELAGEPFVINSPKQLSSILFEKLQLPAIKKTKTGYSTDAGVLEELAEKYDLPKEILRYRSLSKLKSTYIDVLPLLADKSGRVHTTFNQAVTATGRLSSSDPNLQNIPARSEEGLRIRRSFVADKGMKLLSADYSQIELRILAHISKEPSLLKAFENDIDIHAMTACLIFGVEEKDVTAEMRSAAKTVNFGVLYGQGAFGLSKQLGVNVDEASAYIKNYYKSYPKVEALKEKILEEARKNGYVETLMGRRRYIPDILGKNKQVRSFAERTAFNAVFQGTAADIIKKAMIDLDHVLTKELADVTMLLQVHDELVLELSAGEVNVVTGVVREKMEGAYQLIVPLKVDIGTGDNWAEC